MFWRPNAPRRRGLDVRTIPLMPFAEDSHPAPSEEHKSEDVSR